MDTEKNDIVARVFEMWDDGCFEMFVDEQVEKKKLSAKMGKTLIKQQEDYILQ